MSLMMKLTAGLPESLKTFVWRCSFDSFWKLRNKQETYNKTNNTSTSSFYQAAHVLLTYCDS